jgi:outer membrane receptor protein involved in Fe transport
LQNVSPVSPGISQAANPGYLYSSYPLAPQNARAADWDEDPRRPLRRDDNYLQGSLRLDYDLNDNLKVTSISAFQRYNQEFGLDTDGAALEDFLIYDKGYIHSINQELRLTGDYDQLKFILGANYSRDRIHQENRYNYAESSAFFAFSGANFFGYSGPTGSAGNFDDQKVRSVAVFGNVDYSLNDLITVHAGLRYTKDKRHYVGCTSDGGEGTVSDLYNLLYPLLFGRPFNIQPGECTSATITATEVIVEPVDFRLNEDNVSWRVGVDFQVTPTTLVYANVSRGYKSGSFPAINVIANAQLAGVTQESVLVYEAGFKAGLFDRRVQLNAAAFYNDYSDKQLRGRILDPFGVVGILDKLVNVPKSRVYGGEVELKVVPMRGLDLDFSATYTDTKVTKSFFAYDPVGNFFDHKGLPFPHTPKWNVNASANYEFPVSDALNVFAGASLTYRSGSISVFADRDLVATVPLDPANKPGVLVPRDSFDETSYTLIDAQLGVADPDSKWRAWIWGKNIFNTYYWSNATQSFDSIYRIASMPATYGASVSFRF